MAFKAFNLSAAIFFLQESKIYGSHFKEITADAPKPTKITFGDSDEDWYNDSLLIFHPCLWKLDFSVDDGMDIIRSVIWKLIAATDGNPKI